MLYTVLTNICTKNLLTLTSIALLYVSITVIIIELYVCQIIEICSSAVEVK